MPFVDTATLFARAGRGGNGCVSFRREKYVPMGGPNGGDGGKGGSVFLEADLQMGTLLDFSYHPHRIARDGEHGQGWDCAGRGAKDLVVRVPLGTLVYKDDVLVADLVQPNQRIQIAKGGRGGRGNHAFKTHSHTAPRIAEKGEPGESCEIRLELKLIADVGLLGLPNAGKSTLLSRVSNARPKIAGYPFTTLAPHLGLVRHKESSFVLADIPGLIEGAHAGKGLGNAFLRHLERTRLLLHLVDPLGFPEGISLARNLRTIELEIRSFGKMLAGIPRCLVVTKMDLPQGREALSALRRDKKRERLVFAVSAVTGEGIEKLLDFVVRKLADRPKSRGFPSLLGTREKPGRGRGKLVLEPGFALRLTGPGRFELRGRLLEREAAMTHFELPESMERFQRFLKRIGMEKELGRLGVSPGDVVRIGTQELEWQPTPGDEAFDKYSGRRRRNKAGVKKGAFRKGPGGIS